jgi:hypothetical protein
MVHSWGLHRLISSSCSSPHCSAFCPTPTHSCKNWSQTQLQSPNPTAVPESYFRRMWRSSLASHGPSNFSSYRQYQMLKIIRNRLNYQIFSHGPYIVLLGHVRQHARYLLKRWGDLHFLLSSFYSLHFRSGKNFRWRNMGNQYFSLFLGNVVNYILIIGLFRKYISLER